MRTRREKKNSPTTPQRIENRRPSVRTWKNLNSGKKTSHKPHGGNNSEKKLRKNSEKTPTRKKTHLAHK
jgi:hypothetical protein